MRRQLASCLPSNIEMPGVGCIHFLLVNFSSLSRPWSGRSTRSCLRLQHRSAVTSLAFHPRVACSFNVLGLEDATSPASVANPCCLRAAGALPLALQSFTCLTRAASFYAVDGGFASSPATVAMQCRSSFSGAPHCARKLL